MNQRLCPTSPMREVSIRPFTPGMSRPPTSTARPAAGSPVRRPKSANLLFAHELAARLARLARAGFSVVAASAHPGYAATDLQPPMPSETLYDYS